MYPENALAPRPRGLSIALGALLIILGICAMIVPFTATMAVIFLIGWLLIIAAVEQAIYAFRSGDQGGVLLKILLAVLYGVVGTMVLRRPVSGAMAATAIIATLLIIDGVMEIALGFQLGRRSRRTGWLFAGGVLSLLMGIIIWRAFPLSATWVIGLFVGIRLIFKGVEHIMLAETTPPGIDQRGDQFTRAA